MGQEMAAAIPESVPKSWYALQVRHNYERFVSDVLNAKGFTRFLPTYPKRRRWSDRTVEIESPLFPGYVFCQFDFNDRRVPIVTTPGVIRIVGVPEAPLAVDALEIAALQKIAAAGLAAGPWPFAKAGQRVRVKTGPLAGVEGVLVEMKNRQRLIVSISLLQRSIQVDIDSVAVDPD
jgi:transcription antitermination factor NusG